MSNKNLLIALQASASPDTAFGEYNPTKRGKLHNHCGCVAYSVQKIKGGTIKTGTVCGVKHYWNFIDGKAYDFTAEQFSKDVDHIRSDFGKIAPARKTINPRFKKFFNRLTREIK